MNHETTLQHQYRLEDHTHAVNDEDQARQAYQSLGQPVGKFEDAYYGRFTSRAAFAQDVAEEAGLLQTVPDNLRKHIDFRSYAHDLLREHFIEVDGHYFWNGGAYW